MPVICQSLLNKIASGTMTASPLKIEGLESGVYRDVPGLGEHGAEILAEAGLSAEQIADMKAKGALGGE